MNRTERAFQELRAKGQKALVAYLTAGDPDIDGSERIMLQALENGVDILELGMPFSDPTADGPTIQAAGRRALRSGTKVRQVLEMAARLRKRFDAPIVLFGYANPFFIYGYENLCRDAAAAGIDGLLVVDMPFEEQCELRTHADKYKLYMVELAAPTTPKARAATILKDGGGFVYYIMVTGVTGAREKLAAGIAEHVARLRECTKLPIVVGFGISNGEQARLAASAADGVVVGSALIEARRQGKLAGLVRELRCALDG